jgi:hypothetical protein
MDTDLKTSCRGTCLICYFMNSSLNYARKAVKKLTAFRKNKIDEEILSDRNVAFF